MHIERGRSRLVVVTGALLALSAAACASSSTTQDIKSVRDLAGDLAGDRAGERTGAPQTQTQTLPDVHEREVDPASDRDVHKMLEAPLDADAAVRVALLNNRELRATLRELGVARGALVQAGTLPNPVFEAELLPERNSHLELRVEYEISALVLAPLRARAAEPQLEAARFAAAGATVALAYRARAAFYATQAAAQRLRYVHITLDASAAARDAARALRGAGNETALALALREAQYEKARVAAARFELDVVRTREALSRVMGVHGDMTNWQIRTDLPPPPDTAPAHADVETRALRASLELRAAQARTTALGRRAGLVRAEGHVPDVAVDLHALAGDPTSTAGAGALSSWRLGGGVSVGLPSFNRRQGQRIAADAAFDAELERYYGLAVDVRSDARLYHAELTSAHGRAHHLRTVVLPLQRRVSEETLLQYNAMQASVFHLLTAKRDELDVELAYVEALAEYWTAQAAWDALLKGYRVRAPQRSGTPSGSDGSNLGSNVDGGH
jgi:outer membrane protein TolC